MMELDKIYNCDCLEGLREMESGCVDLVIADPPYEFGNCVGGGAFGTKKKDYHGEISFVGDGFNEKVLVELIRVCKVPNMYFSCNKEQLPMYFRFAVENKLNYDLLMWHKSNPVPMCNNKYLSDTEYVMFMRGKGAKVYGTFETKKKWWVTPLNVKDKKRWGHPTIKPLEIVRTLVGNSSLEGGGGFRPFHGKWNNGGCGNDGGKEVCWV